jgi:hypothetical protein
MNQHVPQDETVTTPSDQTTPTEAPVQPPRFPLPLGVVLLVVFCGLVGPACYIGLAMLQH